MDGETIVSICVITYNHGAYIAETIDSLLSQKTDFKYKIVIGEDKSKDNTREICEAYAQRHPNKIELLSSDRNYGMIENFIRTLLACEGKYIAICEGDDYWVDDYKLQKQYDLLKANPDKVLCFTESYIINATGERSTDYVPVPVKDEYTMKDVLYMGRCYIHTATLFFRNILQVPLPGFFHNALSGDIALQLILLDKGNAVCLREETAVYRKHAGGITNTEKHLTLGDIRLFTMFEEANRYYNYKYLFYKKRLFDITKTLLFFGSKDLTGWKRQKHLIKFLYKYFKYAEVINVKDFFQVIYVVYIKYFFDKVVGKRSGR